LQESPLGWALLAFFGFGLLLAFTPCMLPMVPILSALIIGEQHKHHKLHALRLAFTYVFAMACTYASLGALVASLGARVQAQLQHPAMLSFTAVILVAMAILLFNDKALSYAARINHPLDKLWQKLHAGKTFGVAAMGIISALIISPCVTPPLIGALTYISSTGNVVLGACALFLLAMGMGTPLLIVAWGGTALLPNRGPWLNYVKHAFAVILLLMAASLVARFAAPNWDWRAPFTSVSQEEASHLPFIKVASLEDLSRELEKAKGKPVMLDFYADWCTTCITLERSVFKDPKLSAELTQIVLLKADVTDYNDATKALMAQWQVYGPPALLFFDAQGNPVPSARVDGLVNAPELSSRITPLLQKTP
jgi:thiol:disulfide interchange protein DsbD